MVLPLCTQYQELQASAQLQGDNIKEAQMQISQLRQAVQRLQSQIASLKKQVGSPCLLLHPPAAWCLCPPLRAVSFPGGLVGGCVTDWDSETDLQVTSELNASLHAGFYLQSLFRWTSCFCLFGERVGLTLASSPLLTSSASKQELKVKH